MEPEPKKEINHKSTEKYKIFFVFSKFRGFVMKKILHKQITNSSQSF